VAQPSCELDMLPSSPQTIDLSNSGYVSAEEVKTNTTDALLLMYVWTVYLQENDV
jgi:hypothetical protein